MANSMLKDFKSRVRGKNPCTSSLKRLYEKLSPSDKRSAIFYLKEHKLESIVKELGG